MTRAVVLEDRLVIFGTAGGHSLLELRNRPRDLPHRSPDQIQDRRNRFAAVHVLVEEA